MRNLQKPWQAKLRLRGGGEEKAGELDHDKENKEEEGKEEEGKEEEDKEEEDKEKEDKEGEDKEEESKEEDDNHEESTTPEEAKKDIDSARKEALKTDHPTKTRQERIPWHAHIHRRAWLHRLTAAHSKPPKPDQIPTNQEPRPPWHSHIHRRAWLVRLMKSRSKPSPWRKYIGDIATAKIAEHLAAAAAVAHSPALEPEDKANGPEEEVKKEEAEDHDHEGVGGGENEAEEEEKEANSASSAANKQEPLDAETEAILATETLAEEGLIGTNTSSLPLKPLSSRSSTTTAPSPSSRLQKKRLLPSATKHKHIKSPRDRNSSSSPFFFLPSFLTPANWSTWHGSSSEYRISRLKDPPPSSSSPAPAQDPVHTAAAATAATRALERARYSFGAKGKGKGKVKDKDREVGEGRFLKGGTLRAGC